MVISTIANKKTAALYEVASDGNTWAEAHDIRWSKPTPKPVEHWVSAYCAGCGHLCMVDVSVFEIAARAYCHRCHRLFGHTVSGVA